MTSDSLQLVIASNRLPCALVKDEGGWHVRPGSGGLVTAMAPVLRDRGGVWIGWPGAVALSSGTAALHLSLAALGIHDEDRVALPSYASAALWQAVGYQRATPVLCDSRMDGNLDPRTVAPDCRAVIVPHLFGRRAALPKHPTIIEDIAQSIGGSFGQDGVVTIASFYATKMMTSGGEGGMLLTDDAGLADSARDRRDYDNRDDAVRRYPYKMTDLQAAIGREQLKRLPGFVARRREIAARYREAFRGLPVRLPDADPESVWFRFVIGTPHREAMAAFLGERGVDAKRPVHRPAHQVLGGTSEGAEALHTESVSIPIYPALKQEEIEFVIRQLCAYDEPT